MPETNPVSEAPTEADERLTLPLLPLPRGSCCRRWW